MSEYRRMTSTARRINRHFLWRTIWTVLLVDAAVLLLAIIGWCYTAETAVTGSQWMPRAHRSIVWEGSLPLRQRLGTAVYRFQTSTAFHEADMGPFLQLLANLTLAALPLEAALILLQYRQAKKKTRRLLQPLHDMAETAQALSSARFDEQKFHHLEDAIDRISPSTPDARLVTGDRDLEGLELAINNLMTRMHDAYRQQIRFVSDASHELRTPISVIQGYAGMLDRWGKDDEKVLTESITAIKSEAANMQKLVEQLLFLARGDTGRQQLAFHDIDLSELMREVHEEYEMIDTGRLWRLQAADSVPAYGDAAFLKQTARILADNAARYSQPSAPITLRSYINQEGVPCMAVQDNGAGIAPEELPYIFERFYRSDPARARNTGGTGLGLSIAKWIVDQHGGYFDVISRQGVGSRFVVCLPKAKPTGDEVG